MYFTDIHRPLIYKGITMTTSKFFVVLSICDKGFSILQQVHISNNNTRWSASGFLSIWAFLLIRTYSLQNVNNLICIWISI